MKKNSILLIFIGIFIIIPTYAQTYTDAIDSIFSHISRTDTSATYWPDYVFENDYNLMTLRELEQYVTANKHPLRESGGTDPLCHRPAEPD